MTPESHAHASRRAMRSPRARLSRKPLIYQGKMAVTGMHAPLNVACDVLVCNPLIFQDSPCARLPPIPPRRPRGPLWAGLGLPLENDHGENGPHGRWSTARAWPAGQLWVWRAVGCRLAARRRHAIAIDERALRRRGRGARPDRQAGSGPPRGSFPTSIPCGRARPRLLSVFRPFVFPFPFPFGVQQR